MRNIVSFTHASLDGYVAGPQGEMDWITYTDEVAEDARRLCDGCGGALYGRTTYEMMAGYWPTVLSEADPDPRALQHAKWVQEIPKVVFSTTMDRADWNNTTLVKQNLTEQVMKLKQQAGDELLIFGSPRLTHSLAKLGLIDQYHINLNPIALGKGMPLFDPHNEAAKLNLLKSHRFDCGVISLRYEVVR
jgi:dihydrofolate reductase